MPKKIFQNTFSKILFLIFIFSIFSTFINQQKTNAFSVDTNTCAFTSTSSTSTVVSTADLTGTLPLCFWDANNGDRLTLWKDDYSYERNTICFSNTKTGSSNNWDWVGIARDTSSCTTGGAASTTFPAGSVGTPNRINFPLSFTPAEQTNGRWYKEQKFYIKDSSSVAINAEYKLTLLPATIGMTASTSVTGHNVTGNKYGSEVWSNAPYLKYGDNIDITCTNSTAFEVQENNTESSADLTTSDGKYYAGDTPSISWSTISSSTKDYNGSVPLTQVPTIANNYTLKSSFSYDWARPFKYYYFNCQNIGGSTNRTGKLFLSPKKFTISYRNPAGSSDVNTEFNSASTTGGSAQGAPIWDGQSITLPTTAQVVAPTGYKFDGWYSSSTNFTINYIFPSGDFNCGASCGNWGKITIYAKWVCDTANGYRDVNGTCSNTYTVTFNNNGGTTESSPIIKTVTYNTETSAPATSPTKIITGGSYPFLGWGEANNSTTNFDFNTNITANKTLYARWGALSCNGNDGFLVSTAGNSCKVNPDAIISCTVSSSISGFNFTQKGHTDDGYIFRKTITGDVITGTCDKGANEIRLFHLFRPNGNADRTGEIYTAINSVSKGFSFSGNTFTFNVNEFLKSRGDLSLDTTNARWIFDGRKNANEDTKSVWAFDFPDKTCGVGTLDTVLTTGSPCVIQMNATTSNATTNAFMKSYPFGTSTNPWAGPTIYLKWNEKLTTSCSGNRFRSIDNGNTIVPVLLSGFNTGNNGLLQETSFDYTALPATPPVNKTWTNGVDSNNLIHYRIGCDNIGNVSPYEDSNYFKNSWVVFPKKFYVKYKNPDPARDIDTLFKTGGTNDTPQFANNTHSIWDGQSVLQVNNLTSIPTPTTIPTGYRFERWCNSSTFSTCTGNGDNTDTAFNFNNTTWTDGTNENDINIYAKWTEIRTCPPSTTTNTQEINASSCTLPRTGQLKQSQVSTTTTSSDCSVSTTPWVNSGSVSDSGCACPSGYTWNSGVNKCQISCTASGQDQKTYDYNSATPNFKCPSAPQNISCIWTDDTYTKYKLSTTDGKMCKDSSNNDVSTYLISTKNSSQATNTNYHIATSTTNPTYKELFTTGSFDASKYINQNTGGYIGSLSIACPTLLNSSGYPLLKDLSCGNNPIPRFTLLDVSAKNVKAGTGINIFWNIRNPNTSCNIEAKKISNGEVISSFASSSGSNLYANITGTSTILNQILGLKTNLDGSKTITSNYATNTNTNSFFTINESTRFIGYCKWQGATTTPIIRDVYVSGGGEN